MPADYKSRAQSKRKQKNALPGYVWLLAGLAIGLFVAFIVYLDKQPDNPTDFATAVQRDLDKLKAKAGSSKPPQAKPQAAEEERKAPRFNFYTLLPDLEVMIPDEEIQPPDTGKRRSEAQANKRYLLQLGSFQNLADAEKLKASVALLGIETSIENVRLKNQTWHRVRTAPFDNKQQLYQHQKLLQKNHINAIAMELK